MVSGTVTVPLKVPLERAKLIDSLLLLLFDTLSLRPRRMLFVNGAVNSPPENEINPFAQLLIEVPAIGGWYFEPAAMTWLVNPPG